MTIPVWPSDLPQRVLAAGFQSSVRGNRLTTATDTGPGKQRRRGPAVRPVVCSIALDEDSRSRFERFYEDDLDFGVQPFLIPDQQIDGAPLLTESGAPLEDENGNPILVESWWLAQFGQQQPALPATSPKTYNAQFALLVLP